MARRAKGEQAVQFLVDRTQILPRPACTPMAIRAVLAANASADILQRYDQDPDTAFERVLEQSDLPPLVQAARLWWFEAYAWRDPEGQREFLCPFTG